MSYLMIKRQLQEEFGEDIWLRNKDEVKRILRKKAMQKEMIKRTGSVGMDASPSSPTLSRNGSTHGVEKELFHIFRGDGDDFDSYNKVMSIKDDGRTVYLKRPAKDDETTFLKRKPTLPPLKRILIVIDESALAYPKIDERKYHVFKTQEKDLLFSCIPSYPHLSHFNMELAKCMKYIVNQGLNPDVVDVTVLERNESRRIRKDMPDDEDAACWAAALDTRTRQYFYIHRKTRVKTWISPFALHTKEWAQHTDEKGYVYYHNKKDNSSKWTAPKGFMKTAMRTPGGAQHLLKTFGIISTRLVSENDTDDKKDEESYDYLIGGVEAWLKKQKDFCSVLFLHHDEDSLSSRKRAESKITASTTKMMHLKKLFESRLCVKYKHLESMVLKSLTPGEKFESYVMFESLSLFYLSRCVTHTHTHTPNSYARDLMSIIIRRRPWPQCNDLIRWDLDHNCMFKGDPIECKWHRSRWSGNRQTSKSYDSVIRAKGSLTSSQNHQDISVPAPKYKLLLFDKLGSGSYGLVCRAIADDGKFVAVKIYDNAKIEKQNMTEDVAKELGVMIKLNRHHTAHVLRPPGHRNVLAILGYYNVRTKRSSSHVSMRDRADTSHDDDDDDNDYSGKISTSLASQMTFCVKSNAVTGHMFVVMEIAKGGSFYDHCDTQFRKHGPFKEDRALEYFKQIVEGLQFMHDRSFVHRDLKLENMLLGGDFGDVVKLCDFGFSTWVKRTVQSSDSPKHKENDTCCFLPRGFWDGDEKFGAPRALGAGPSSRKFTKLKTRVGSPHYVAPGMLTLECACVGA
jgi:hypothetical protein